MYRFVASVAALMLLNVGVGLTAQTSVPKDLVPLQGTWVLVSSNGQDMAGGPEVALVITGDKYSQTVDGEVVERGSLKVDVSKKPMTIDLAITEGADANTVQLGVIDVTDDTMKGNLNAPGATERPAAIGSADGAFTFVAHKRKL